MAREIEACLARIRQEVEYLRSVERRVLAHPGPKHAARHFQLLSLRLKVAQLRGMEEEFRRAGYRLPGEASGAPRQPARREPIE
jgi:hypothetical protein